MPSTSRGKSSLLPMPRLRPQMARASAALEEVAEAYPDSIGAASASGDLARA